MRPNMSLELTPTVTPENRFVRGVGFESMIEWTGERSSAPSRWAANAPPVVPPKGFREHG
jgi:hypothetical protein